MLSSDCFHLHHRGLLEHSKTNLRVPWPSQALLATVQTTPKPTMRLRTISITGY
jgi:hypothetical protein